MGARFVPRTPAGVASPDATSAARAGTVTLKLKPSKATRKLLRKRSLKSTLKLSFTAQGSTAKTTKKVKLKRLKR